MVGGMGSREMVSPGMTWAISRVLLYQCLTVTGIRLGVCREPHCFVLLDEISGGCMFPAVLGTLSAVLGTLTGSPLSLLMWL